VRTTRETQQNPAVIVAFEHVCSHPFAGFLWSSCGRREAGFRGEAHRYRRKVGINRARVNFHSLRKNFVTCLDNADWVSQGDVAAIVGHERGFTFDRYSEGKGLPALKAIIERVKYPGLKL